ncbi:hypothetical protein [Klebsiella michiganensis]|uniref:hypothetical protein n=2 Tax=Klebsiella michiganensis TaxID=1134687 RepID=UPI001C7F3019|nr:hypothetical protein [Klebsiella michiganensis]MBX4652847.1 hypothetical protein [Klebsiella michiganensis]MDL4402194.1 hypothetical protein [Klebsiella michiganensis]MDL4533255.1 hypothetical protein [Klebsiella michiganensis]
MKECLILKCIFLISIYLYSSVAFANDGCENYGRKSEASQTYINPDNNSFEVISTKRLHFFSSPNKACKIKDLFLVPGDIISGHTEYNGYVSASYAKNESWSVTGWLDKSQLKHIDIKSNHPIKNHCELVSDLAATQAFSGGLKTPSNAFATAVKTKVMLYNAPDRNCPKENTFIIKGDNVYALKKYADFILAQYVTTSGKDVFGWITQSELKELNPTTTVHNNTQINIIDFIVIKNKKWIGVGSFYSNKLSGIDEDETGSSYIGDFPNTVGGLYKYTRHSYKDISLVSSNANYDKRQYTIDDEYIISAINLETPAYSTLRGIKVGDPADNVFKAYPADQAQITPEKISYTLGDMYLDFTLKANKVASINMGIPIPGEE